MKMFIGFIIWLCLAVIIRGKCEKACVNFIAKKQSEYAKEQERISANSLFKSIIYGLVVAANVIAAIYLDYSGQFNAPTFICLAFTALISLYEALDNYKTYKDAKKLFENNKHS